MSATPTVSMVTLGCARNEVDSEELAARLESDGFRVVDRADRAQVVLVNTCGFIEAAKKDSIDAVLELADGSRSGAAVVAVGCLAERYGDQLAQALPEAAAVIGFDDYPQIADRLRRVVAGERLPAHQPRDRRTMLPITPAERSGRHQPSLPGHGQAPPDLPAGVAPASGPRPVRRRLGGSPVAPLKIASGCDRRCSFCAIPSFRGAFVSRPVADVVAEAAWLSDHGVRELLLVSENSTSYGKDLGDLRLLETLLPKLAEVPGIVRVRVSYLQPAEMRPGLVTTIATTPGVAPYYDLSFQHAAPTVLRAMRRFGDPERFLGLLDTIRANAPLAGVRSNVIVGFPGERADDVDTLCAFLESARLDAVGVFGYSAEDGTAAAELPGRLEPDEVSARVERVTRLAEELTAQRAEERVGEIHDVLVEARQGADLVGRGGTQGPDVDGSTTILGGADLAAPGDLLPVRVVDTHGVDLVAEPIGP